MPIFHRWRRKSTIPLTSSALPPQEPMAYLTDGKWRHLAKVPYLLSVDAIENERWDIQHHFLRGLLHAHSFAPLDTSTVRTIFDSGCGTGRWVNDMAQEFPPGTRDRV